MLLFSDWGAEPYIFILPGTLNSLCTSFGPQEETHKEPSLYSLAPPNVFFDLNGVSDACVLSLGPIWLTENGLSSLVSKEMLLKNNLPNKVFCIT